MPNYWSGTNCRASGWAQIGEGIYAAELSLNGEPVETWIAPDPEILPLSVGLKVMFDSSHFSNGTEVEVTYRVWGLWSGMHEAKSNPDPVVKNKLMMFEDPDTSDDGPDPVPTVYGLMAGKNYAMHAEDGHFWSSDDFRAAMWGSNVIFFSGHGAEAHHTSPINPWMTHAMYQSERTAINGTGLPPFNSTIYPQVNFCHLVACICGRTDNFKKALYPYYMGWGGGYLENQAVLTFTNFSQTVQRWKNSELIWEKLALGWTVGAVRAWLRDVWLPSNPGVIKMSNDTSPTWRNATISDWNLICGEDQGAMRLKSVYTGTNSPPANWFRSL